MFNRCIAGIKYAGNRLKSAGSAVLRITKRTVHIVRRDTPGTALVSSRGGSAVFNSFHFSQYWADYLKKSEIGYKSPIGIALAVLSLVGAAGTNIVTRFFNLRRKTSADLAKQSENPARTEPDERIEQDDINEKLLATTPEAAQQPIYHTDNQPQPASCCYPGIETSSWHRVGYVSSQVWNSIYGIGSGLSGILSARNLVTLIQLLTHLYDYEDECNKNESNITAKAIVNLFMFLLMYANSKSFKKYNLLALREYYPELFIEDGWREISYWDRFKIFTGATLSSINVYYANQILMEFIKDNMLCHVFEYFNPASALMLDKTLFKGISKGISGVSATANFIVTSMMTSGAIYNRQKNERLLTQNAEEGNELARQQLAADPAVEFGCYNVLLRGSIIVNAGNAGLGTFVSTVHLPEKITDELKFLTTNNYMIAGSSFAAIIGTLLQYDLDHEGVRREIRARIGERSKNQPIPQENVLPHAAQQIPSQDSHYVLINQEEEKATHNNVTISIPTTTPSKNRYEPRLSRRFTPPSSPSQHTLKNHEDLGIGLLTSPS